MAWELNLPSDLLLVRHGQSEANVVAEMFKKGDHAGQKALVEAGRHDGHVRLTDKGRDQARAVGHWVRENCGPLDLYYVSQYVRTRETAVEMELPYAHWTLELMIRERDQGLNEGRGSALAFTQDEQDEKERHQRSKMYWAPVGGESVADVCLRVRQFLHMLQLRASGMRVIVVCHHQVINAFRIVLEDRPQPEYDSVLDEHMPNCCLFWYTRRDQSGIMHERICHAKKVEIGLGEAKTLIEEFQISPRLYTNAELRQQIEYLPQLVNNDGVVAERKPTPSATSLSRL